MKRKINAGLIGGGEGSFIGIIHYKAAMLDGEYNLVCGAFSSDYEKSLRSSYGVARERVYPSWEEMLEREAKLPEAERMEAVIIVTPNHLHYPQSMKALELGFHVICDKPATISLQQALDLEQKVKETGRIFALTHTYCGYPMVMEARDIVASGKLGKIRKVVVNYPQGWLSTPVEKEGSKQAIWRTDPSMSGPGGCLGDIGTHAANLAEYITGLTINQVCADVSSILPGRKLDDDVSVLLRFDGGARGVLLASQISAGEENNLYIRVYGEKGGLEWNHADPNTLLLRWLSEPTQILRAGTNYAYLSEKTRMNCRTPGGHPEGYIEAFANIYRNVAWHIHHLENPQSDLPGYIDYPGIAEGVKGMRFVEKVLESAGSETKWTSI